MIKESGPESPSSEKSFVERGWVLIDVPNPEVILAHRVALLDQLRSLVGSIERLEDYHLYVTSDEEHLKIQQNLSEFYWTSSMARTIAIAQLPFLHEFIGADLLVQTHPYLRIVRPGKRQDNIGFHRDTHHGSSPFEVSMLVTFTELDERAAFRVLSGSHAHPESKYPYKQLHDPVVKRGSSLHRLGFPYAPKVLDPNISERAEAIPMRVGQALFMSLGIVHGQEINCGDTTRISSDIRIVNSFAPVQVNRGVRDQYYTSLCSSPVSIAAKCYLDANPGFRDGE